MDALHEVSSERPILNMALHSPGVTERDWKLDLCAAPNLHRNSGAFERKLDFLCAKCSFCVKCTFAIDFSINCEHMNVTAAVCVSLAWTYAEKLQFAMGFFAPRVAGDKNGKNPRIGQSKHGIASKKPSTVNELHLKCISAPSHTTHPRHANLNIKPTPPARADVILHFGFGRSGLHN